MYDLSAIQFIIGQCRFAHKRLHWGLCPGSKVRTETFMLEKPTSCKFCSSNKSVKCATTYSGFALHCQESLFLSTTSLWKFSRNRTSIRDRPGLQGRDASGTALIASTLAHYLQIVHCLRPQKCCQDRDLQWNVNAAYLYLPE